MTIREAIAAEIEPYSLSDDSIEKGFVDSTAHFGVAIDDVEADYHAEMVKIVALAAMYCLNRLRVLSNENIGGISQAYDTKQLEKRIRAIALQAGLSAELVLSDDSDTTVTYMPVW